MSESGRSDRRPPPDQTVGERIAFYRRRAGLSQAELAGRLGRSTGYLANIEQGSRPLDRLPLLRRLADALGVTIADIHPDAAYPAAPVVDADPTGLLAVLAGHPELHPSSPSTLSLEEATAAAAGLEDLDDEVLVASLVELLPSLDAGAANAKGRARARWEAPRCVAYRVAADALARAEEPTGSWVATERAIDAGSCTDDPLLGVAALLASARSFLVAGRLIQAHAAATTVAEASSGEGPKRWSLAGAAHLVLAEVVAARADRRLADEHLSAASTLADRVGEAEDHYRTGFSSTAVALTAMRVFLALEDAGRAKAAAEDLDATALPDRSRARYLVDYARAELLRAQPRHALALLVEADRLAPELAGTDADMQAAIASLSGFSARVRGGTSDLARLRQKTDDRSRGTPRSP